MAKVSIIIPSRNETYEVQPGVTVLQRMIRDIYEKATGDFEVLVAFDGPPYQKIPKHSNLRVLELPDPIGLKPCVNLMAGLARGKYLYKSDSHCMFGKGFDEILQTDMEDNWLVTPRFYVLDAENWKWQDERHYDYFFLHCPLTDPGGFKFKAGGHWPQRTAERESKPEYDIDETMQMHGSGWFVAKEFFWNNFRGMSSEGYDNFAMEPPELCLKTWLGPWNGKVMVNKKTWYAHMHKGGQRPRGWPLSNERIRKAYDWCARYWMGNKWEDRVHDLSWLIERFDPVPTWPDNWKHPYKKWLKERHG
ncbi:MAG: glycosyltransferase [bacterium]|nr:glycosyltransferase [bacterium]